MIVQVPSVFADGFSPAPRGRLFPARSILRKISLLYTRSQVLKWFLVYHGPRQKLLPHKYFEESPLLCPWVPALALNTLFCTDPRSRNASGGNYGA